MAKCISCEKQTPDGVKLVCPGCGKEIFRCSKCRSLSTEYKCKCGYEGP